MGRGDLATGARMRQADRVRIGSITKTVTVTGILQLVQSGKVRLGDSISMYVSGVPDGNHVTIRELANMTSGVFPYTSDQAFLRNWTSNLRRHFSPMALVRFAVRHPLLFAPGTHYSYSNTNTILLGLVIQKVTHMSAESYLQSRVLARLRLHRTVFPQTAALPAPYAHGYSKQLSRKRSDTTYIGPSAFWTAGGLVSTLADLRIWARALGRGTLLNQSIQRQRLRWLLITPNGRDRYGLGIAYSGGWLGHFGVVPGYNSVIAYLPQRDATIVVLTNSDTWRQRRLPAVGIASDLSKIVLPGHPFRPQGSFP